VLHGRYVGQECIVLKAVIQSSQTRFSFDFVDTAVARNPSEECNPFLGSEDVLGIFIGLTLTIISLAYTGWSYTADKALGGNATR
jgi:hypothetical protein